MGDLASVVCKIGGKTRCVPHRDGWEFLTSLMLCGRMLCVGICELYTNIKCSSNDNTF